MTNKSDKSYFINFMTLTCKAWICLSILGFKYNVCEPVKSTI